MYNDLKVQNFLPDTFHMNITELLTIVQKLTSKQPIIKVEFHDFIQYSLGDKIFGNLLG